MSSRIIGTVRQLKSHIQCATLQQELETAFGDYHPSVLFRYDSEQNPVAVQFEVDSGVDVDALKTAIKNHVVAENKTDKALGAAAAAEEIEFQSFIRKVKQRILNIEARLTALEGNR